MIKEVGQVTAIDASGVWLNTIAQSTCNACKAKSGCGQRLLNQIGVASPSIWAGFAEGFDGHDELSVGDWVEVAVEDGAVVLGSLLAYGLPIVMLVVGAMLGEPKVWTAVLGAASGLVGGALLSRYILSERIGLQFFQPVVVGLAGPSQAVTVLNS